MICILHLISGEKINFDLNIVYSDQNFSNKGQATLFFTKELENNRFVNITDSKDVYVVKTDHICYFTISDIRSGMKILG